MESPSPFRLGKLMQQLIKIILAYGISVYFIETDKITDAVQRLGIKLRYIYARKSFAITRIITKKQYVIPKNEQDDSYYRKQRKTRTFFINITVNRHKSILHQNFLEFCLRKIRIWDKGYRLGRSN